MDVSNSIKSTENSLRDLFHLVAKDKLGKNWIDNCGLSPDRVAQWRNRQVEERKRLGQCDPRLLYYCDFYDLSTISSKLWNHGLASVFNDLKELKLLLKILERYRNPDAHQRGLLPYQTSLAIGIAGKIRTEITRYMSELDGSESVYTRLESVQDSIGNTWSLGQGEAVATGKILRPGQHLEFNISANDPFGEEFQIAILPIIKGNVGKAEWTREVNRRIDIDDRFIQESLGIAIAVRSNRKYHGKNHPFFNEIDDFVTFMYVVRPPRHES